MVLIAGTYQHVKNENLVQHLMGYGVPEDKAKKNDALRPKLQVIVDGKKITLKSESGEEKYSASFILDEEVEEKRNNNFLLKSTAKLDGDTLTISSTSANNSPAVRIYKFSDTELSVTVTSENPKIPTMKRFYKRL